MGARRVMAILCGAAAALTGGTALAACSASSSPSNAVGVKQGLALPARPAGQSDARTAGGPAGGLSSVPGAGAANGATGRPTSATEAGMVVSPASELIIRTGSVTLLVKKADIVTAFGQVSHDVEALGGFVASSRTIGAGDAGGAELVLRVPSSSFSTLVTDVDSVGKVQDLAVGGQDVTGQSIDLQAQITNLKSEETALRNLLSSAGSIPNLLQVQDQLFGVQGEVQQLTAQEGSLLDRATFATLSVHLTPRAVAVAHHPTPRQGALARAFQLAVHNTVVAFKAVVTAIGWAFPLLIVGGVVAFVVMWRRRRPQGNSPTPAET